MNGDRPPLPYLFAGYEALKKPPFFPSPQLLAIHHGFAVVAFVADHSPQPQTSLDPHQPVPALWILSGVHGDEPAGPITISEWRYRQSLPAIFSRLSTVVIPLLSPAAYFEETRLVEGENFELSNMYHTSGIIAPENESQLKLQQNIDQLAERFIPKVILSLHEDDRFGRDYCYVSGDTKISAQLARAGWGAHIEDKVLDGDLLRYGEYVNDGIAAPIEDGSIEEYLCRPDSICLTYECGSEEQPVIERVGRTRLWLESVLEAMEEHFV